jgi:FtsP/CotA-like multicopper oxidase with cupredoxin domain
VNQLTPHTGVTRKYHFDVTRINLSPDGYEKSMIAINKQFPGPLIEANWGDWIEVTVTNSIQEPADGTAMHWHGLLQHVTPWYDGVPGSKSIDVAQKSSSYFAWRCIIN